MKLRVSQVGDTLKVNKERDLSRCGLLSPAPAQQAPLHVFLSSRMISDRFEIICGSSFTLTGFVRCRATIGTTKSGYEDKCNSFLLLFLLISLSLIMDRAGLAGVVVDRSNVCCLLHGDFLVRA